MTVVVVVVYTKGHMKWPTNVNFRIVFFLCIIWPYLSEIQWVRESENVEIQCDPMMMMIMVFHRNENEKKNTIQPVAATETVVIVVKVPKYFSR